MKYCFFVGFYPEIVGGAEYQSRLIANLLSDDNEVIFISYPHSRDEVTIVDGIKVYKLTLKHPTANQISVYYFFSRKIYSILKRESPDVLYQRVLNTFSTYLAFYAQKLKIPFLLHIADDNSVVFDKYSIRNFIRFIFFKLLVNRKVHFICQTDRQKGLLHKQKLVPDLIVPNFHLPLDYHPKKINGIFNVVWIANVRPFKQLEVYLDIVKAFLGNNKIFFHCIGNIPMSKYGVLLKEKINQLPNLRYHGSCTNEFINNFLSDAHLLVNTSKYEGFSNTFIQAWMKGVPVLSLNCDPNEFLTRYPIGIFCNGDLQMLLEKINQFSVDSQLYQTYSTNARKVSLEHFSVDKNKKIIIDYFAEKARKL